MNSFLTRSVTLLALIGVLVFGGLPTYRLADKLSRAAIQAGWVEVVGVRWKTPEMFVIGCQINPKCKPVFASQWNKQYDWRYAYGALAAGFMTVVVFVVTTKRRKHLYNARWARPSRVSNRSFDPADQKLERGIQLAYLWKSYPEIQKNRYGFLEPLDWGDQEGRFGGKLLASVPRVWRRELGHTMVVGPTRCGKGLGLTQNLLVYMGSVIVNDPKGENVNNTAAWRASQGQRVRVIDPTGRGDRFDPFTALSVKPESLKMACALIADDSKNGQPSVFAQRASYAIFAAVQAAIVLQVPVVPYLRALTREGLPGFVSQLSGFSQAEVFQGLTDFLGYHPRVFQLDVALQDKFLMSCWNTAMAQLYPLFSPGILASSAGSDFELVEFFQHPSSLYLVFAETDLPYTGKYLQVVWLAIIAKLSTLADELRGKVPVRVMLGIDEAGVVPVPALDKLLATIAGRGMDAVIYVQDEQQLISAYGLEGAGVIKSNCQTKVYYAPRDEITQKSLSFACGEMMLAQLNRTRLDGKLAISWSSIKRTLIAPDETRMLHEENVIVVLENLPPILGRRLNYLRHPLWRKAKRLPRLEIQDLTPQVLETEVLGNKNKPQAVPFPIPDAS